MENQYFIRKQGKISGPLTAKALKTMAADRRLVPTDEISRDKESWVAASNVRGLRFDGESSDYRPFDVFISYSTQNKLEADAVCAKLEESGIRCWIAPRDILPGTEWGEGIVEGIDQSRLMLLIFSGHSNNSSQVRREVDLAIGKQRPVIPFRLENLVPTGSLVFCLGNTHWFDAFTPPLEQHISRLVGDVRSLLSGPATTIDGSTHQEPKRPLTATGEGGFDVPHTAVADQVKSSPELPRSRFWRWLGAAITAGVLIGLSAAIWTWTNNSQGSADPTPSASSSSGKALADGRDDAPSTKDARGEASIVDGPWTIDRDELVQPSLARQENRIVFGDPTWSHYNIDLKVMATDGPDDFKVFFNYADPASYRIFTLGAFENTSIELTSRFKGEWSADQRRIHPGKLVTNRWYHVRIEVRGAGCRCLLDNEQWAANTDERLAHGCIGLATWRKAARFRDIVVTSEDGKKVLWKGNPELPTPDLAEGNKGVPAAYLDRDARVLEGTWTIQDDDLVQSSLAERDGIVVFGDPKWSRYNFSVKAKATEGIGCFKVYFNFADLDNYRVYTLGAWKNTSHDVTSRFNASWDGANPKGDRGKIEENRWYDVRLEVRGPTCRCMLNGELWFEHTDKRLTKGRIGVGTWATAASFRDIVVTSEDGKTAIWQGNPTLPAVQPSDSLVDQGTPKASPEKTGEEVAPPVPAMPDPLRKLREVRVHEKDGIAVIKVVHEGEAAIGIGWKTGDRAPLQLNGDWIRFRKYHWNYKTKQSRHGQTVDFIYDP